MSFGKTNAIIERKLRNYYTPPLHPEGDTWKKKASRINSRIEGGKRLRTVTCSEIN